MKQINPLYYLTKFGLFFISFGILYDMMYLITEIIHFSFLEQIICNGVYVKSIILIIPAFVITYMSRSMHVNPNSKYKS